MACTIVLWIIIIFCYKFVYLLLHVYTYSLYDVYNVLFVFDIFCVIVLVLL